MVIRRVSVEIWWMPKRRDGWCRVKVVIGDIGEPLPNMFKLLNDHWGMKKLVHGYEGRCPEAEGDSGEWCSSKFS